MAGRKFIAGFTIIMVVALTFLSSCQDDDSLFAPPSDVEDNIFDHINHYRLLNGYAAIDRNSTLDDLASSHSQTMTENNSLSHVNQSERYEQVISELNMNRYGELVASGKINGRDLIEQWSDDQESNETILGDYSIIGIGVADGDEKQYVTVIFAK